MLKSPPKPFASMVLVLAACGGSAGTHSDSADWRHSFSDAGELWYIFTYAKLIGRFHHNDHPAGAKSPQPETLDHHPGHIQSIGLDVGC